MFWLSLTNLSSLMPLVINNAWQEAGENIRTILFDILTASAVNWAADELNFLLTKSNDLLILVNYTIKSKIMKGFVESTYKVKNKLKSMLSGMMNYEVNFG